MRLALALALAPVVLLVAGAQSASATFPGANGKIAYADDGAGSQDIVLHDPATGVKTPLATGAGRDLQPAWSPDGEQIVFQKDYTSLWVIAADGTGLRQLLTLTSGGDPTWSADGQRIFYTDLNGPTTEAGTEFEIWSVPVAGGGPTLVVPGVREYDNWAPAASADGQTIAFVTNRDNVQAIYVAPVTGGEGSALTSGQNGATDSMPDFSPDAKSLVFLRDGHPRAVAVNGGASPQPLFDASWLHSLRHSPDGKRVTYSDLGTTYVADRDNGNKTLIGAGNFPDWQPVDRDRDGDGLLDSWETDGYDHDGDGTADVDLPAMGADPNRKDVFVEIDYMTGRRLDRVAIQSVVDAFGRAPVSNPSGVPGIALHVDNGDDSEMNPLTHATWGARSRQDVIPTSTDLASLPSATYDWVQRFDPVKAANFDAARKPIFHYAISALDTPGSTGGQARGESVASIAGSDFVLTLDPFAFTLSPEALRIAAGTFMHELGHNLALRHGGADNLGRKPNYLSVMNYIFQGSWLRRDASFLLDYSRSNFPLDEGSLDESGGFGLSSGPAGFWTEYACGLEKRQVVIGVTDVDWNCDNLISATPLAADLNADGAVQALAGHLDWPALRFDGGEIGAGARFQMATGPAGAEPPFSEVLAAARRITDATVRVPPGSAAPPVVATPPAAVGAATVPIVTRLRLRPALVRPLLRGGSVVSRLTRRRGTTVSYQLSTQARVGFTIRRVGARRSRVRGGFTHRGRPGANAFRFSGRNAGRALRPGRYRLVATPTGGRSASAPFRVR